MEDKALGLLGLMRRAGAVQIGEDKALDAIQTGKVKLLLLSADVSDRARRRAEAMTNGRRFQLVETHYLREALGLALGVGSCAMAAVTDLGFANALMKELAVQQPERYDENDTVNPTTTEGVQAQARNGRTQGRQEEC